MGGIIVVASGDVMNSRYLTVEERLAAKLSGAKTALASAPASPAVAAGDDDALRGAQLSASALLSLILPGLPRQAGCLWRRSAWADVCLFFKTHPLARTVYQPVSQLHRRIRRREDAAGRLVTLERAVRRKYSTPQQTSDIAVCLLRHSCCLPHPSRAPLEWRDVS